MRTLLTEKSNIPHIIKTKQGNFIRDKAIIDEIKITLDYSLKYTYIDKKKVSIVSDDEGSDKRITIIEVCHG